MDLSTAGVTGILLAGFLLGCGSELGCCCPSQLVDDMTVPKFERGGRHTCNHTDAHQLLSKGSIIFKYSNIELQEGNSRNTVFVLEDKGFLNHRCGLVCTGLSPSSSSSSTDGSLTWSWPKGFSIAAEIFCNSAATVLPEGMGGMVCRRSSCRT